MSEPQAGDDASLDPSRARRARSVRAGEAGRGGPARARARARRQARVERGAVRAVPRCAGGDRPRRARAEPLSRRRRVAAPQRARRAARRPLRAGDRLRGRRRGRRLRLPGDARPGRRGRHRLAVVPELRPRPAQARRRPGARAAARRADRPGCDARRDHAADEARLHRGAEQSDGHDERPRRARRVLRARSAARPHRRSTRRTSSTSTIPTIRTGSRSTSRRATGSSSCGRSRRSTGSPGSASGTGSAPRTSITAIGKVRRAFDVTSVGQEAALASLGDDGGDRAAPRREPAGDGAPRRTCFASTGSSRPGPRSRTSSSSRVGDADGAERRAAPAGVIVRPLRSFGAPDALRITAGTPDEIAFLGDALAALAAVAARRVKLRAS